MHTDRRNFLKLTLALGAGSTLLGLVGCGDDDGPGTDAGRVMADGGDDGGGLPDSGGGEMDAGGGEMDAGDDAGTADAGDDAGSAECSSVSGTIASNHGHVLSVPVADVEAAVEKTYDIMGSSHPHLVVVTAANFVTLAGGTSVMIESSTGGSDAHTHFVTIMCV